MSNNNKAFHEYSKLHTLTC